MIYLTTSSDGNNTEGIGAMVQTQLACYTIAKSKNIGFYFQEFKNFTHYQNFSSQQEFMHAVNKFFNFYSEIDETEISHRIYLKNINQLQQIIDANNADNTIVEIDNRNILRYFVKNDCISFAEKESTIRSLKKRLNFNVLYDDTIKNIAVHIRKFTETDCCNASIRDLFTQDKSLYYINLIESLSCRYSNFEAIIKIISQGNKDDYDFLKKAKLSSERHKIEYMVENHPIDSIQHMINSDVLAMSNSSFSWISHLYGEHELVCVKSKWNHPMYSKNVKIINADGNLIF